MKVVSSSVFGGRDDLFFRLRNGYEQSIGMKVALAPSDSHAEIPACRIPKKIGRMPNPVVFLFLFEREYVLPLNRDII